MLRNEIANSTCGDDNENIFGTTSVGDNMMGIQQDLWEMNTGCKKKESVCLSASLPFVAEIPGDST